MSDQDSIFNSDQTPPAVDQNALSNSDGSVDQLLQGIQNEQGEQKYKNAEDAIKALQASQEHIQRLEAENSDFKSKATTSATLQSVLDAVKPPSGGEPQAPAAIDEAALASLVESVVSKRDTAQTQTSNVQGVANKFNELYGDQGEAQLYAQAEAKGLTRAWINQLAAENPAAVFNILGVDATVKPNINLSTSVNSTSVPATKPQPTRFDPFQPRPDSDLDNWRKSVAATHERLGITE